MNHCYRLVFNRSTQVWQVVSEIAKSHSKSAAIVLLPLLSLLNQSYAWAEPAANALPAGGQLVSGQSTITQNGNQLNIVQGSQKSIINWQSYNIGSNAEVNYIQNNASSISLNRVITSDPSAIFGKLNANGQVWLINPNGVVFGKGAQVNVGGLLASTLNIADDDFINGKYQFTGSNGSIVNMGAISASQGGYVAMLAPEVRNEGVISAMQGTVALAAGNAITLDFNGNGLINVQVDSANVNTLVENKQLIQVGNGQVLMSTKAADGLITSVINNSGKIEANGMVDDGGVIRLTGAKTVINSGEISATSSSQKGGTVHLLGDNVGMFNSASINVSGKTGGGTILVGGDYQGKNVNVQNAAKTFIHQDATLIADATESGDGGKVIVWADDITRYYGSTSAKGGAVSGNGGFVEISGKRLLNFLGNVDLSAVNGIGGHLLLDPTNITISNGLDTNTLGFTAPLNLDITEAFADDAGSDSIFDVTAGTGSFAGVTAGSTITLQANNDITILNAFDVFTATGSVNNSLVLEANRNINVNAALSTTGTGALTLRADADNNGVGNLAINASIATDIGGANLYGVNVTSIAGATISTVGAVDSNSGNLNITASDSINLAASLSSSGGSVSSANIGRNAGNISLSAGKSISVTGLNANGSAGSAGLNSGNAGSVSVYANTGISISNIGASGAGASLTGNGGDAGNITISNLDSTSQATNTIEVTSTIIARAGAAIGTGIGGKSALVNVKNEANTGDVDLGAINVSGNQKTNGGSVEISSEATVSAGAINVNAGTNVTDNTGQHAGNVTISGVDRTLTSINASGGAAVGTNQAGGNAGSVSITGSGFLNISTVNVRTGAATGTGASGLVGSVHLAGSDITTADITTAGQSNGHGGSVSATASGLLTLNGAIISSGGAPNANSAGTNAGAISLSGNVINATATIAASGNNALGVDQAGGNGAAVTLNASGNISTRDITATGGSASGTNAKGGDAGSISITTSAGDITTNSLGLDARTGGGLGAGTNSTAGFVAISNTSATGAIVVGSINTSANVNGHGGNVSVMGNGVVNVSAVTTSGGTALGTRAGFNAGNVTITGAEITTQGLTADATAGIGANQAGGNGGVVSLNATAGTVNTLDISTVGGDGTATDSNGGNGGNVTLNAGAGSTITMRNITTSGGNRTGTGTAGAGGDITIADNALFAGNSTLSSTGGSAGIGAGGAINFSGTVNSIGANRSLNINSNGATTFAGAVGNSLALSSVSTDATGTTVINGGSVVTTGTQTYNDALSLGAATTFTTTNSDIHFANSINANANNVVVAAGLGILTATNAANNFGNLAVTALSANVRDADAIVLGASDVANAYSLQTAGNITQTAGITVGGISTLNAGATGDITLSNATNDFSSVAITSAQNVSLVDSNALTIDTSALTSVTARTLSGDLSLGGNITASGAGDAVVLASAANFLNSGNSTLSTASGRWLVYANTHTGNAFGGLTSGSQAIYNRSFPTATAETGNRYVFANSPNLDVTSTNQSKTYGQDGAAIVANAFTAATFVDAAAFGSVFTQDTIANSLTGLAVSTGSANTANVGSYAIDVTPITSTNGYTLNKSNAGNLTVNAAVVNLVGSRVYDGTAIFNAGAFSTFATGVNGETLNVAGSGGSVASKNVGAAQTLTTGGLALANGSGLASNYTLTGGTHTGTITVATLNLNAVTGSKTYDGNATSSAAVEIVGLATGDTVTGLSQSFASRNALGVNGSTLNVDAGYTVNDGNSGNNYTIAAPSSAMGTIAKATLNLNAVTDSKTYDGNTTSSAIVARSGLVGGDTITGLTQSFASKNVMGPNGSTLNVNGGYTVNDGNNGNNYTVATPMSAMGTIMAASLSITANNASKVQGNVNPAFSSSISGFVGGDTSAVLAGALSYYTDADIASPIGTYTITPSGVTATNYAISFFDGALEVTEFVAPPNTPSASDGSNISTFNNATTRPEQAVQTCNQQGAGLAMINGLDEFGVDDVDYQSSISQPQVGGVIANGLAGASCSKS